MTPEYREFARNNLGAYHLALSPQYHYVKFQQECIVPALHAVADHRIKALMFLMCFGHGKTELGTLSFNSWLIGKYPGRRNMLLSYSDDFANEFGGKILSKVKSEQHREIFPDCELSPQSHSKAHFLTTQNTEFYSAGFNGAITGRRINGVLTMDDPVKNKLEATSATIMQRRVEDYRSAASTRLEGGSRVLTTTRWCTGDFVDRLLDMEGEVHQGGEWIVLKIPAEAGKDDLIGRQPGEYLWPEFLGEEWYAKFKKDTPLWNSMCQQEPKKNLGKFFKRDWLCFYPKQIRPGKFPAYMLTDPARSKGKENDRTCAIVFVATPERRLLIVDAVLARLDPGERGKELVRLARKWQPRRWLYEEIGLMTDTWYLKEEGKKAGIRVHPEPVGRKGPRHMMSKASRIEQLIPDFREGRIWLPDIWGDREEGRLPVPFPTMINDEDKEQNIIEYFIENEYVEYAGEKSILHDEFLDALEDIHYDELGLVYPSADIVTQGRAAEYRGESRSWESIW